MACEGSQARFRTGARVSRQVQGRAQYEGPSPSDSGKRVEPIDLVHPRCLSRRHMHAVGVVSTQAHSRTPKPLLASGAPHGPSERAPRCAPSYPRPLALSALCLGCSPHSELTLVLPDHYCTPRRHTGPLSRRTPRKIRARSVLCLA